MLKKTCEILTTISQTAREERKKLLHTTSNVLFNRYYGEVEPHPTKYGGKSNVAILPGVGIGPEIMEHTLHVLEMAEAPLYYEKIDTEHIGTSEEEFDNVLMAIKRNKVALKGNIEVRSKDPTITSRNIALRKKLDLYVNVLHAKSFPGLNKRNFGDIDAVVIRQNTEGEYLMLEHEPVPGTVENLKIITRYNSERIAKYAFEYAIKHNRKHITVLHNAHVQPLPEGVFIDAVEKVAKHYPQIPYHIDEAGLAIARLLTNPSAFDIILATNLNGSFVGLSLTSMIGGAGMSSGMNYGVHKEDEIAVFEPGARNKGMSIVGQGRANPIAMLLSAVDMLRYLNYNETADLINKAIYNGVVLDQVMTPDLGGNATTAQVTENIIYHIKRASFYEKKRKQSDRRTILARKPKCSFLNED